MWTVCSFSTLKTSISLPFDSHSHWEAKFILLESVVRDFWPLFWFLTRTWLGFFITIVCLFLTLLGLPCSVGFPPVAVCGFLVVVASLLRSTGSKAWAQELWCTDFSCPWHRRYPDQGSNLCPLAGRRLLTHCTTNKVSWWYKIFFKNWFFFQWFHYQVSKYGLLFYRSFFAIHFESWIVIFPQLCGKFPHNWGNIPLFLQLLPLYCFSPCPTSALMKQILESFIYYIFLCSSSVFFGLFVKQCCVLD